MKVAKSYQSWNYDETKAYEKNGKLYVTASCKCYRCMKGVFVCRVENGKPVPHPYAGGVCFACGGSGIEKKEVRLYTDEEYERMEKANQKAKEKRQAEQEKKMQAEFAHNREVWLKTNGFNKSGESYIVLGNSYAIKDVLKEAGFHFNGILKRWMRGEPTDMLTNPILKVNVDDIVEFSAWGKGNFRSDAKKYIDMRERDMLPPETSEWVGDVGKRIPAITVTLEIVRQFQNQFGLSHVYKFRDEKGNQLVWFSSVNLPKEEGDTFVIAGTVKDHGEYNGVKQTILTRCRICKE